MKQTKVEKTEDRIAIVGMACRFPGAKTIDEFWENLKNGVDSLVDISEEDLKAAGIPATIYGKGNYVPRAMVLEDSDLFDAKFFEITGNEAQILDPQQRLLLECAWEALESAGYPPKNGDNPVGVFMGSRISDYLLFNQHPPDLFGLTGEIPASGFQRLLANDKDYIATRISYKLNLHGPSLTVQTACSTSLVAIHLASQSLLGGECEMGE